VPFGPGSVSDSIARIVGKELAVRLGQPVIVDNKPGASGIIAAQFVARSTPDGYTLLLTGNTTHSANPWMFKKLPYDPVKDFAPVILVGDIPYVLVTSSELPIKTTQELVSYLKANPKQANYAFANSTSQIAGATFTSMSAITAVAVPYKSSPQALVDLMGGGVQYYIVDVPTALTHVRSGKIRPIAMAAARTPLLPGTPPLGETLPGFSLISWNGILTTGGTPEPVVARLNKELRAILQEPRTREQLSAMGLNVGGTSSPQEFQAYLAKELQKWGKWVKDSGIEAE
jgi:tripartite-type tricarboxylate transporter receptor subunit TctC